MDRQRRQEGEKIFLFMIIKFNYKYTKLCYHIITFYHIIIILVLGQLVVSSYRQAAEEGEEVQERANFFLAHHHFLENSDTGEHYTFFISTGSFSYELIHSVRLSNSLQNKNVPFLAWCCFGVEVGVSFLSIFFIFLAVQDSSIGDIVTH